MAQPVGQLFEYLGGAHVKANTSISTESAPSGANVVIFKSVESKAFVDGTDAFMVRYGEATYFDNTTPHTYTFTTDVDLAFARVVSLPL